MRRLRVCGLSRCSAAVALLMVTAAGLTGCELFGALADKFVPKIVHPIYELPYEKLTVLIDDPTEQLGSLEMTNMVAARVGYELKEEDVVPDVVPPGELGQLRARLGDRFAMTPVPHVGRAVGAKIVIFVRVESVQWSDAPRVFEPKARVRVSVIDADQGRRLFPASSASDVDPPPHATQLALPAKVVADPSPATFTVLRRQFADQLGLHIAQLFFAHEQEEAAAEAR